MKRKYLRITKRTLSFLLVGLTAMHIWADETGTDKTPESGYEVVIPSAQGGQQGLTKIVSLHYKDAKGLIGTREAKVLLILETGCVWVGLPNSQCFLRNGYVLGITPFGGPDGGNLLVHISTNKLAGLDKTDKKAIHKHLDDYLSTMNGESITPTTTDKSIPLGRLFGRDVLMNLDKSDGAKPVQILNVRVNNTGVNIKMKSGLGAELVLILDNELNPLKAEANGRTTFEIGKIQPPSLIEELRNKFQR